MDPVKYSMRYGHCMNCGWEGPETEMSALWPNIPDLNNRVEPGEEVPLGECPECESLCRLMNNEEAQRFVTKEEPMKVTCSHCGNSDISEFYVLQDVVELHNEVMKIMTMEMGGYKEDPSKLKQMSQED